MVKKVTLGDVAAKAGCSTAVVSTVLNHAKGRTVVSDQMRAKVEKCAKELGYVKNFMASNLSKRESFAVGLAIRGENVNFFDNGFWNHIIVGAEVELAKQEKSLILIGESYHDENFADSRSYQYLLSNRIGSLIIAIPDYWIEEYENLHANIVWLMNSGKSSHPSVCFDSEPGIIEALDHLKKFGHKHIFWFGNNLDRESIKREKILKKQAEKKGFVITFINKPIGERGTKKDIIRYIENYKHNIFDILANNKKETAAICYNETIASAVYGSLHEQGKLIPKDFSIIAFDDIFAHTFYPALTVISHELSQIGAEAAKIAIELENDKNAYNRYRGFSRSVPGKLVKNKSVGPAITSA